MTGETFGLLSRRSTLRHSVSLHSLDEESFAEAATRALRDPAALTADLFSLRAEALLHDLKPDHARARLSGLLIGAEMAAMRSFWEVGPVTIVGADALARLYETALASAGIGTQRLDGEAVTLAGLIAAQAQIPPFELGDAPA